MSPGTATAPAPPEARRGDVASLSVCALVGEARSLMEEMGVELSANRLQRVIRRYLAEGRADVEFRSWFLGYADPTGEAAVRNVLRGQW